MLYLLQINAFKYTFKLVLMVPMERIVEDDVDIVKPLVVTKQMESVLILYALLVGQDRNVTGVSLCHQCLCVLFK